MTRCPACGTPVDGDVCDPRCADIMDARRDAGARTTLRLQAEQAAHYHLRMSDVDPNLILELLDATEAQS